MVECERCSTVVRRRHRCVICKRLVCAACIAWSGVKGDLKWCFEYSDRERDCKEPT